MDNAPELNPTGGVTVMVWVRRHASNPLRCEFIVAKSFARGYALQICRDRIRYYAHGDGTQVDGTRVIPVGRWTHLAVTFDRVTRRYFIDGVLDHESRTPMGLPVTTAPLGIGADGDGAHPFQGDVAGASLWSVALTEQDIRRWSMRLPSSPRDGLIAAWHLEGNARDALGQFPGTVVGSAAFSGPAAPPLIHDPIVLPRVPQFPGLSACGGRPGDYGPVSLPIWYGGEGTPRLFAVAATDTDVYVCVAAPHTFVAPDDFMSVYIDPEASDAAVAQPDDFRLNVFEMNSPAFTFERGVGSGAFASAEMPGTDVEARHSDSEFTWWASFRISRRLLTDGGRSPFRLQAMHHWRQHVGDDYGWPVDGVWNSPQTWPTFRIDDSATVRADAQNPTIVANHSPTTDLRQAQTLTITADAFDDVDVATIEVSVGGSVVQVCDFAGSNDTTARCTHSQSLTAGLLGYTVRVVDHRGRFGQSAAYGLIVRAEGIAPQLTITHTPRLPGDGALVTLIAEAADPTGLTDVVLNFDVPPFIGSCNAGGAATHRCSVDVTPPAGRRVLTYYGTATDRERLRTTTLRRSVLFGNDGPDTDRDGLSDASERLLGLSEHMADTDRDALKDSWEVIGLEFPGSADRFPAFHDLPAFGTTPRGREVLVQNDYERGARFEPGVLQYAVNLYRRYGITLRIQEIERPRPTGPETSRRNAEQASAQRDASERYWFPPLFNWTHQYVYNRHASGRSGTWQYATIDIYKNLITCPHVADPQNDPACRQNVDAIGRTIGDRRDRDDQIYRFVHELGHELGLGHGGWRSTGALVDRPEAFYYDFAWDDLNYKPNHFSAMNYAYDVTDLCWSRDTNGRVMWGGTVGYHSWLAPGLTTLDENALDERPTGSFASALAGIGACPAGARPAFIYTCVDPDEQDAAGRPIRFQMLSDGTQTVARVAAGGQWWSTGLPSHPPGIDWNCDGQISTAPVSGSINGDGSDMQLPAEPCDGTDNNGDRRVDEGCQWRNERLDVTGDWQAIPRGRACHVPTTDTGDYPQHLGYRQETRGVECGTGIRHGNTAPDREEVGPDWMGVAPVSWLPNLEICDGADNDRDGAIDEGCADSDADGVSDDIDNCPRTRNADQTDADGDWVGDACGSPVVKYVASECHAENRILMLSWSKSTEDVLGYNLYRQCGTEVNLTPRGAQWPSTTDSRFSDLIEGTVEGPCEYHVRPVTLAGAELAGLIVRATTEVMPPACKVRTVKELPVTGPVPR